MVSSRRPERPFGPASFAQRLFGALGWPQDSRFVVAYSGGCDSAVLLDLCAQVLAPANLRVIHVNHGLQADSDAWAGFCRNECARRQIPCDIVRLRVPESGDVGLEAAAREARYEALASRLQPGEVALTAHHLEDQAETFLLRLMRGAGPLGLGAMQARRPLGVGWLARPLLSDSRQQIKNYARAARLVWLDDPSNADTRFARNWLRHRLLPILRQRWPQTDRLVARAAGHQAGVAALLAEYAAQDLAQILHPDSDRLQCEPLSHYSAGRLSNLLRYWLSGMGVAMPAARQLQGLVHDLRSQSLRPRYVWAGVDLRRYRGSLYRVAPGPPPSLRPLAWHWPDPLAVPELGIRLRGLTVQGQGISQNRIGALTVRMRMGGERFRYAGHLRTLKKMLQERGMPPWERARLPLLYAGPELVAVAGLWVATPFAAAPEEAGLQVIVEPLQPPTAGSERDTVAGVPRSAD